VDSREVYRKFAQYYDTFVGGFSEDLPMYLSICDKHDAILEVGCGTGRVLSALLGAGHHVIGVDISSDMLTVAEGKLHSYLESGKLKLLNHDLRLSPVRGDFNCVLVSYFTFNYLLDGEEQSAFLSNILALMQHGGVLVMDLMYPASMSNPAEDNRWKELTYEVAGSQLKLRQSKTMIRDIEKRIQIFAQNGHSEEITTYRRYVSKQEAFDLLTSVGFGDVKVTDGYDQSSFHAAGVSEPSTSSFVVMATKV